MEARPRPPRAFFTVAEAAAILRMSENHIRNAIRRGELAGRKVGRAYRVSAAALNEIAPAKANTPSHWPQRSATVAD